jgi:hypothetical protein
LTIQNRNTALTIGTTQVIVSPRIPEATRKVLVLTNVSTGTQRISIGINAAAVDSTSITLYPGDSWVESIDAAFTPTTDEITAVASAASATLAIHERIDVPGV